MISNLSETRTVGSATQLFMKQNFKRNSTCYNQDLNYFKLRPSETTYCRAATIAVGHGER